MWYKFSQNRFVPYAEASQWGKDNGIKSEVQWSKTPRPTNIPSAPRLVYKDQWKGWGDFLNTGHTFGMDKFKFKPRPFISFEDAREYVRNLKLKNGQEWIDFTKSSEFPDFLPKSPHNIYFKNWKGIADWLGYNFVPNASRLKSKPQEPPNVV